MQNGSTENQANDIQYEQSDSDIATNRDVKINEAFNEPTCDSQTECPNESCDSRPPHFKVFGELLNSRTDENEVEINCDERLDSCECPLNECCAFCDHPIEEDTKNSGVAEDRRLKAWERELQLRKRIAKRIMKRTGKMACEILFNRRSVDDRDKIVLQRFLDHADRLPNIQHSVTKELVSHSPRGRCEQYYDTPMREMLELPSSGDAIPLTAVEISGVPARVRQEMYGTDCNCTPGRRWIDSKELKRSISQRRGNLKRLLEFFPDLDNLIVVGRAMTINKGGTPAPKEVCNCGIQVVDLSENPFKDISMMRGKLNGMNGRDCQYTAYAIGSTTKLANVCNKVADQKQCPDENDSPDKKQPLIARDPADGMQYEIAMKSASGIAGESKQPVLEHSSGELEATSARRQSIQGKRGAPSILVDVTVVTNTTDNDDSHAMGVNGEISKSNNTHTQVYKRSFAASEGAAVASMAVIEGNGHRASIKELLPQQNLLLRQSDVPSDESRRSQSKRPSPILSIANGPDDSRHSKTKPVSSSDNSQPSSSSNTDNENNQFVSAQEKSPLHKRKSSGDSMIW